VRLRLASLGILSGLLVGILMGLAARIAMRIVALVVDQGLEFTVAGTLGIILVVSFSSVLLGLIFVAVRKYLPGAMWRGLAFSVLLLVIVGLPSVLIPLLPTEDLSLGMPLLNKSMFAALPLIYGLTLGIAEKAFDHYLPGKPTPTKEDLPAPVTSEK